MIIRIATIVMPKGRCGGIQDPVVIRSRNTYPDLIGSGETCMNQSGSLYNHENGHDAKWPQAYRLMKVAEPFSY
jgi:hypothetical protein